jgi:hypothetical protein
MQVKTQPFKQSLELKNDGISFNVYGNGSKRLGDLYVTKAGLVWSKGANANASRDGGINVKWEEFITWVQSRRAASKTGSASKLSPNFAAMKQAAMKQAGIKQPAPQGKSLPQSSTAGKPASQPAKAATQGTSAGKPGSRAGKLAASHTSAIKLPSAEGKLAAKRASQMKLAAAAKSSKAAGAKSASKAKPAGKNGNSLKLSTAKASRRQTKKVPAAAAARKAGATLKTSAALARKAH